MEIVKCITIAILLSAIVSGYSIEASKSKDVQLLEAAKSGHVAHVIDLIQQDGININARGNWRQTPLFEAADNGHLRIVQILLGAGADPTISGSYGKEPFGAAMKHGYVEIAEALIHAGIDVDNAGIPVDRYGGGPHLITAAAKGDTRMLSMLIRNGANVDARNRFRNTALIMAANTKKTDVAKMLIQAGADVNIIGDRRQTALMHAVGNNNVELVKALIEVGADVCIKGMGNRTAVTMAQTRELKELLTEAERMQGLCKKMQRSSLDTNLSDSMGISKDAQLLEAAKSGHVAHVIDLIEQGANVNTRGNFLQTPLLEATKSGHLSVVKILINAKADLSQSDFFGEEPFWFAINHGDVAIAKELIDAGINVNSRKGGSTALINASARGDADMVLMLIRHGANLDATNEFKNTALIMAANTKKTDVAKILIQTGADVNIIGNRRQTALMHAIGNNNVELVKALIGAGADVYIKGMGGKTAVMIAQTPELKELLTEAEDMQRLCEKMQKLSLD